MSQLTNLKAQIESLAGQATTTAGGLDAFKGKFSQSMSQVQQTIGGSAQRKDQELLTVLQDAQAKVDSASAALRSAASSARAYGASL